ncbi:hypothetical protein ANN_18724 [Periplaneta americana]|uniref:Transposase Tc1-like domain-containing protein n=1 Tax=Periplaneta americana TaxID=6978 RepID=A0ABQ8SQZ4_PERAM|nr:hypothetical protein ANN_18724 [Periplaneta americana]
MAGLCECGNEPPSSLKASKQVISRVKKALDNDKQYSSSRVGKCGQKRIISPRTERKLVQLAKNNRRLTSKDLRKNLEQYGVNVCDSTVYRKLIDARLHAHRPRKKASGRQYSLKWVCFSDEFIFEISEEYSQYVRRTADEEFKPQCIAQKRQASNQDNELYLYHISEPIISEVSKAVSGHIKRIIKFPAYVEAFNALKVDFCKKAGFPGVISVIDGTHVPINNPGGNNAEIFRNRKDYFSINVQIMERVENLDLDRIGHLKCLPLNQEYIYLEL